MATIEELKALIDGQVPESLTLEYKRSDSLGRESAKRNELCKDVSSLANSAGGRIIYGIPERQQMPQPLDAGAEKSSVSIEWIEQILNSNIHPRIQGLIIHQIDTEGDASRAYFVIEIPQSSNFAPHQSVDKKYYKRFNFQAIPMEDYEIRDTMRRSITPSLHATFSFDGGINETEVDFHDSSIRLGQSEDRLSNEVGLTTTIYNESMQPADYVFMNIFIHPGLILVASDGFEITQERLTYPAERIMHSLRCGFAIPRDVPIFREAPRQLPRFTFAVQKRHVFDGLPKPYPFGYRIRCPGLDVQTWGYLNLLNGSLAIEI